MKLAPRVKEVSVTAEASRPYKILTSVLSMYTSSPFAGVAALLQLLASLAKFGPVAVTVVAALNVPVPTVFSETVTVKGTPAVSAVRMTVLPEVVAVISENSPNWSPVLLLEYAAPNVPPPLNMVVSSMATWAVVAVVPTVRVKFLPLIVIVPVSLAAQVLATVIVTL